MESNPFFHRVLINHGTLTFVGTFRWFFLFFYHDDGWTWLLLHWIFRAFLWQHLWSTTRRGSALKLLLWSCKEDNMCFQPTRWRPLGWIYWHVKNPLSSLKNRELNLIEWIGVMMFATYKCQINFCRWLLYCNKLDQFVLCTTWHNSHLKH